MAYSVREERQSLATSLREAGRVMRAVDAAGGMASLRERNPPAQGLWWHLDAVAAADRRRVIRRLGATSGTVVACLAMVWALFTFVIPADANSVITSEAITELRYLAFEERWEDGLAIIEEAKALLTEPDAELLIWEAVVRDKLGQGGKAQEALAEAKALVPFGGQVSFWWTLGMNRLDIGDLEEARAAGNEALALDASDPQGYFLLGNVAEVEGDTAAAIELFEQTYQLAIEGAADELAVIARIRMGTLLQRPANMPLFGEGEPDTGGSGE